MKRTRNYILLVDYNTPPRFAHRTKGRYRVGARSEKEAVRLLQKAIGFGSIRVYRLCIDNIINQIDTTLMKGKKGNHAIHQSQ